MQSASKRGPGNARQGSAALEPHPIQSISAFFIQAGGRSSATTALPGVNGLNWGRRSPSVQNTTTVSSGGQPGKPQAISATRTGASPASLKRSRVHSFTRSSGSASPVAFLNSCRMPPIQPRLADLMWRRGACYAISASEIASVPQRADSRSTLSLRYVRVNDLGRSPSGGKGAGRSADGPEQNGDSRIPDAEHPGRCRLDEDGSRRHLRYRRQALQDAADEEPGHHGA